MLSQRLDDDIELFLLMPYHAAAFFALVEANRAYWSAWHPWLETLTDVDSTREFIQNGLDALADGTSIRLGLRYRGQLAGRCSFSFIDYETGRLEIGYQLGQAYMGKGLMTRAVRAMVDAAFGDMGMQKVEILCATINTKSCAIPQRLGFQQEGIIRRGDKVNGGYHDLVMYGMLAEEWAGRAATGTAGIGQSPV